MQEYNIEFPTVHNKDYICFGKLEKDNKIKIYYTGQLMTNFLRNHSNIDELRIYIHYGFSYTFKQKKDVIMKKITKKIGYLYIDTFEAIIDLSLENDLHFCFSDNFDNWDLGQERYMIAIPKKECNIIKREDKGFLSSTGSHFNYLLKKFCIYIINRCFKIKRYFKKI